MNRGEPEELLGMKEGTIHRNTKLGNAEEGLAERAETKKRSKQRRWDQMVVLVYKQYFMFGCLCVKEVYV